MYSCGEFFVSDPVSYITSFASCTESVLGDNSNRFNYHTSLGIRYSDNVVQSETINRYNEDPTHDQVITNIYNYIAGHNWIITEDSNISTSLTPLISFSGKTFKVIPAGNH
jgi:hypothetical protein